MSHAPNCAGYRFSHVCHNLVLLAAGIIGDTCDWSLNQP
jgi:hypothetical protein